MYPGRVDTLARIRAYLEGQITLETLHDELVRAVWVADATGPDSLTMRAFHAIAEAAAADVEESTVREELAGLTRSRPLDVRSLRHDANETSGNRFEPGPRIPRREDMVSPFV